MGFYLIILGLIWVQQPNGEIFTFTAAKRSVKTVEPPQRGQFICLSVCEEAAWGLHENGNVFIRDGVAEHCPEGAKWFDLDLKQLGICLLSFFLYHIVK